MILEVFWKFVQVCRKRVLQSCIAWFRTRTIRPKYRKKFFHCSCVALVRATWRCMQVKFVVATRAVRRWSVAMSTATIAWRRSSDAVGGTLPLRLRGRRPTTRRLSTETSTKSPTEVATPATDVQWADATVDGRAGQYAIRSNWFDPVLGPT